MLDSKPEKGTIVKEEYLEDLDLYSWTLSNGSVIWLKKTDFQADKIYFAGLGFGGSSLFDLEQLFSVRVSTEVSSLSGLGDLNLPELQRTLVGRVVSASPLSLKRHRGFWKVFTGRVGNPVSNELSLPNKSLFYTTSTCSRVRSI